ncbi:hypothetical protein [Geomicrobium sediminis]|uniref:Uncharacterized protein n=1 Tax=Geomicrobium sediminis TaxID=1347788 RepID=A0ABS2PFV5_9BACL|nr:hypothetical protein [Geomicrobium sediminis]EZH67923.1 hypothetical protein DH09_08370 [Bacillaceae bacterium JMAK1]MBM7633861.1 hypothetical protein [Geomicrobium sediminis]
MCNVCDGTGIVYTQLSYGLQAVGCIACPPAEHDRRESERIEKYESLKKRIEDHINTRRCAV